MCYRNFLYKIFSEHEFLLLKIYFLMILFLYFFLSLVYFTSPTIFFLS